MDVPTQIFEAWNKAKKHGDYTKISRQKKIAMITVRRAIETGKCSKSTMNKINNFYIDRNEKSEKYTKIAKQITGIETE